MCEAVFTWGALGADVMTCDDDESREGDEDGLIRSARG